MHPQQIQNLINQIAKLPSIGPKSAERLVFYLLKQSPNELDNLADSIKSLKNSITICSNCLNYSTSNPCPICLDNRRNSNILCVVSKPQDIMALEKTGNYSGTYLLLGGTINALEDVKPENLNIDKLIYRLKTQNIEEVILAFNPDMQGETTMMYLTKVIKQFPNIKITRLARGLPMGADLEYADEITLDNALKSRQEI